MIDKAEIITEINELLNGFGEGALLVHSDLQYAPRLPELKLGRESTLQAHIQLLRDVARKASLIMPAFNYQFPQKRIFQVTEDVSETGVLTEFFRTRHAEWRTSVPIFSFSGLGDQPSYRCDGKVDPFGEDSIFADVCRNDGRLLFYGAPSTSITMLHYVENMAGPPLYRYDKLISGAVIEQGGSRKNVEFHFHARPPGHVLNYDFEKIWSLAINEGVARLLDTGERKYLCASARLLTDLWIYRMQEDPLYFLDEGTQKWVKEKLDQFGRRFVLSDFEGKRNE